MNVALGDVFKLKAENKYVIVRAILNQEFSNNRLDYAIVYKDLIPNEGEGKNGARYLPMPKFDDKYEIYLKCKPYSGKGDAWMKFVNYEIIKEN